jgi:small-conductance mechanosensitive channel
MARELNLDELQELLGALVHPRVLLEFGVLAACLALAWLIVRQLRPRATAVDSIWFGARNFDGVLFPLVAIALAVAARVAIAGFQKGAVFKLAVPILLSLLLIRLTARVLGATFKNSSWITAVERSLSWIAWIGVVLWVTGVLPLMLEAAEDVSWKMGAARMSLRTLIEGLVIAGLVLVGVLWIAAAVEKKLLRGTGDDLSIRKIAANLVRVLLLFVGLLVSLSAVGIDLTALSVLGGAIGVGLGFGLQKIAANYVSGFVILAERSLRIGDMVTVDNFSGVVSDIRTRYTVIKALNGREAIVPNEMLITQRVENLTLADLKVLISTPVQVAYGTDVRALAPKVVAAVVEVPRVLADPGPSCQLAEFAADGMNLTINFWIRDPENGQGNVRSEVNLAVLDLFAAEGVEIPFPQRVMHHAGAPPEDKKPAAP